MKRWSNKGFVDLFLKRDLMTVEEISEVRGEKGCLASPNRKKGRFFGRS